MSRHEESFWLNFNLDKESKTFSQREANEMGECQVWDHACTLGDRRKCWKILVFQPASCYLPPYMLTKQFQILLNCFTLSDSLYRAASWSTCAVQPSSWALEQLIPAGKWDNLVTQTSCKLELKVSSPHSHCNPAAVFLGCSLDGGSSNGKATQGDESLFCMGLGFPEVVKASEAFPCLPFAESTDLVGYHHGF